MLRRNFLKAAAMTLVGFLFARRIPLAESIAADEAPKKRSGRIYHFHGHARSGCASRPELAPFLEKGISNIPPI
jgi:hypothetical protein